MARGRGAKLSVVAAALAGVCYVKQNAFVSGPARRSALAVAPVAVAAVASAPAFADEIGEASKKLTAASYPFMKEVDWNSYLFNVKPGTASPAEWAKALDKAIVMSASMDPDVLKKAVVAHHKAIGGLTATNPVLSEADLTEVNAAIGRMIASVPESQTMDVYNAFSAVVGNDVPAYLMSTVKEDDAKRAYEGFLEFKDVVKAHPITPSVAATPAGLSSKLEAVGAAAAKLSAASYPFIKDVDWTSDVYVKPLPGASPFEVTKAIDKMLVMGASMDGKLLQEAAVAHHKALESVDGKLVTSAADYEAVNAAIGKLVASVPSSEVMGVFNSVGGLLNSANPTMPGVVANNVFNGVVANDAIGAYNAFLNFKDVVKAAQR